MQRRHGLVLIALAGILLAVVFTGCTNSDDKASSPITTHRSEVSSTTSTTTDTTDTTTEMTDEQAIIAAVDGYWRSYLVAGNPPDPSHPIIDEYTTGDAKVRMVDRLSELQIANQALRAPSPSILTSTVAVLSIEGETANVADCVVDDTQLVQLPSGQVLDDEVGTVMFSLTLQRVDGSWKVAIKSVAKKWEGQTQCPFT